MAQPAPKPGAVPPAAGAPAPGAPPAGAVPLKPGDASGVQSTAPSVAEIEQELIAQPAYPPFPPYELKRIPPSVADTIKIGKDLRMTHKSLPKKPIRPPPRPARPKGAPAGTPKMTRRKLRDHIRCLKKHNVVLSDRLEYMAKPRRRTVIFLWREHGKNMPPATIARLRTMLDADQPLKPDQAYEYFISQQKAKKRDKKSKLNKVKKDMQSSATDKKFLWARNATVVFARGIQQRLSRPGSICLADGMLRLSNIILSEICTHMRMRTPSRLSTHPKDKFMMDISDKVACWIDEILEEADDKMLMMDFDEDDEVAKGIDDEQRPPPPPPAPLVDPEGAPDSAAAASTTPSAAGTPTPSTAATTPGSATPGAATPGAATPKSATPGTTPSGANTPATPASGASTPATSGGSTPATSGVASPASKPTTPTK